MSVPVNTFGTYTVSVYDDGPKTSPVNANSFKYNDWRYIKNGADKGILSQQDCETQCYSNNCYQYSLMYPNNSGIEYNHKYRCNLALTDKNISYSNLDSKIDDQGRGNFTNTNYTISKAKNDYRNNLQISDDYEVLPYWSNNSFNTMCRGSSFKSSQAISKGYLRPQMCANNCRINTNCTSFDISRPDSNGNYDCYNFTTPYYTLAGEYNNNTNGCFRKTSANSNAVDIKTIKDNYVSSLNIPSGYTLLENNTNNVFNTDTMCRSSMSSDPSVYMISQGIMSAKACADKCSTYGRCRGFDIARPDSNGNYDCYHSITSNLYGESKNTGDARGCFKKN
uniref:Uncharacterized protein n=1 Tax=viral metagenome TaxID=1070528 RepID=A0A6C0I704_9ZZZZ